MISNSPISVQTVLFTVARLTVAALTAAVMVAATPAVEGEKGPQKVKPSPLVQAVAKLNGKSKAGNWHLLAIKQDWTREFPGDRLPVCWMVNGYFFEPNPRAATEVEGKLPQDITILWIRLPENGNLDILIGPQPMVPSGGDTSSVVVMMFAECLRLGISSFVIDVADIPEIRATTAEDVVKQMAKVQKALSEKQKMK